ncbi:MAG TPA: hypothetical protein VIH15_05255 [Casimicrobiaceae bacterium]
MTAPRVRRVAPAAAVALAWCWLLAGVWLRYYQLDLQILLEDEWHAVHKILQSGFADIFTSFGRSDYSIPLTLYDRLLMQHGGLTEWTMRMPMFVSGVALLAAAPLLVRRGADDATRALWVGLLAVSPLLVYFSKIARPYSITVLAAFVAIVAVRRWWRRGGLAWAAAYVAGAWAAAWLHPVTLGFTLLPLAYFGVVALGAALKHDRRSLLRLAAIAAALLVLLAATLGPPLYHDWDSLAAKTGQHAMTVESVYRTWLMLAGTGSPVVLAAVAALTAYGAMVLLRRDRELVRFFALLIFGYWLLLAASRATWIEHPLVQARYVLIVLPFLLFATAAGAVALARAAPWPAAVPVAVVALPLALLALGPLPRSFYYPNQFLGHARFQYDYDEAKNPYVTLAPKQSMPAFYDELARLPPASVTLIEAPWNLESQFNPLPFYQQRHRQRIKIGMVDGVCGERSFGEYPESARGLRLRHMVHLSALLRGKHYGADYLVVHKTPWTIAPGVPPTQWPDMERCLPLISARLGTPVFSDDQIVVFALAKGAPGRSLRSQPNEQISGAAR